MPGAGMLAGGLSTEAPVLRFAVHSLDLGDSFNPEQHLEESARSQEELEALGALVADPQPSVWSWENSRPCGAL